MKGKISLISILLLTVGYCIQICWLSTLKCICLFLSIQQLVRRALHFADILLSGLIFWWLIHISVWGCEDIHWGLLEICQPLKMSLFLSCRGSSGFVCLFACLLFFYLWLSYVISADGAEQISLERVHLSNIGFKGFGITLQKWLDCQVFNPLY